MDTPSTEIVAKIGFEIITELFKKTFEGFGHDWLKRKNRKYDPLGLAATKYANKMEARYNSMRIFGMAEPVPLRSIYTRVNILSKLPSRERVTIEELNSFFDFDRHGFGKRQATKDGIEAVNSISKLMVLGKPGAGKTTFLKHIALQCLDGTLREPRIPIFVSLKNWADSETSGDSPMSLMAYIVKEFEICDFPDALQFVERMLSRGRCLVLLDGFDEVNTYVDDVIVQIANFVERYDKNQYILSCRVAAYNYCFEKFTDIEIAEFSAEQVESFINNWFGKGSPKAEAAWSQICENRPIRELAGTPLLLTILCLAFDETMRFPSNKADLYKEGIDALLKKWDASRSITRDDVYKFLSLKRKESMLSRVAAINFQAGQYFIRQNTLERQIGEYIQNLPEHRTEYVEPDSATILRAIEAQHGLFVERAKGIYSFSHLTFQEYFTARYIIDNATRGTLWHLVEAHLIDHRWREVFILVTELLDTADSFVRLMQARIKKFEVNDAIRNCVAVILAKVTAKKVTGNSLRSPSGYMAAALMYIFKRAQSYVEKTSDYSAELDLCARLLLDVLQSSYLGGFEKDSIVSSVLELDNPSAECDTSIHDALSKIAIDRVPLPVEYLRGNLRLVECLATDCYLSRDLRVSAYKSLFM